MRGTVLRVIFSFGLIGLFFGGLSASAFTPRASQIGYHPLGHKEVVLEDVPDGLPLKPYLYAPEMRNPKFPLLLGAKVYDITKIKTFQDSHGAGPASKTWVLDFSDYHLPGKYEIRFDGTEQVVGGLEISEYLYWDHLKPVVKSFYFQRCGQEVENREAPKVFHGACHLNDAEHTPGSDSLQDDDVTGGWHHGRDYAKYTTSTSLAAAKLMALYEWNPKPFKFFKLDYPLLEPGLGLVADLHHEIKAGLDWLLVMQRRDGAVYRKVAGKRFPGNIRPEEDEQARYLYEVTTQDTANFAAVMAMASRAFKKEDLGYSVKCLMAAERAWVYLDKHPNATSLPADLDTAGSLEFFMPQSKSDMAHRLWAAAELYTATQKPEYESFFLLHAGEAPIAPLTWQNPALQGYGDYLLYAPLKNERASEYLKNQVLTLANGYLNSIETSLYPSGLSNYPKGSNGEVLDRAAVLMLAHRLSGEAKYRDAADRSLFYLFGINPLGISYVTGVGGKSVQQPSHAWMEAMEKVIPGYLVAGPYDNAPEALVPKKRGPGSYVDQAEAASVNASNILYNASLAYVMGLLNDAYNVGEAPDNQPKLPMMP